MSRAADPNLQIDPATDVVGIEYRAQTVQAVELAARAAVEAGGWLGMEPTVFESPSGCLLHTSADQPLVDWDRYIDAAVQVAVSGQPEIICEEGPLAAIAMPLSCEGRAFAGVAWFLTRAALPGEFESAARALAFEVDSAVEWSRAAEQISASFLQRLAVQATGRLKAEQHATRVECEVEKLSNHLCQTYEEISLIYRLTHNLTLSRSEEELGELALRWLAEIMPSEGLALQFYEHASSGEPKSDGRASRMSSFGPCPVDSKRFDKLVKLLDLEEQRRPVVANGKPPGQQAWPWPELRDVVLVPMAEGNELFGWLAAFNHADGGEFGTVEADLMNSVTAILGIHRGNTLLYRKQIDLLANMVRALTSSIDAKDPYTRGHSDRVARGAVVLAEALGCDEETLDTIYLSGLLHDIGKIGIDDTVLRKPDKLTVEEFEHIKTHVTIGYNILRDIRQLKDVLPVVLHHHESWDGSGYPHGLGGKKIPFLARITAVADAFDAMGSDRPYRPGMPDDKLDAVLREGAGKQWDADVIDAFFRERERMRQIANGEQEGNPRDLTKCWRI